MLGGLLSSSGHKRFSMTLSGLMSLCTTPMLCMNAQAPSS